MDLTGRILDLNQETRIDQITFQVGVVSLFTLLSTSAPLSPQAGYRCAEVQNLRAGGRMRQAGWSVGVNLCNGLLPNTKAQKIPTMIFLGQLQSCGLKVMRRRKSLTWARNGSGVPLPFYLFLFWYVSYMGASSGSVHEPNTQTREFPRMNWSRFLEGPHADPPCVDKEKRTQESKLSSKAWYSRIGRDFPKKLLNMMPRSRNEGRFIWKTFPTAPHMYLMFKFSRSWNIIVI